MVDFAGLPLTGTAYRVRPPKQATYRSGPWYGMRDSVQPRDADPKYATLIRNMWLRDLPHVPYADSRPGSTQLGSQMGTSTSRFGQRWVQFTKLNGTSYTVGFCGGKMYLLDWGANTTTEIVTTAELLAAGVVINPLARVYCVTVADKLVISDGTTAPWMWDGTAHGGITLMPNCPVLYGQPVVHFAKLVGIKNSEPNTLVWSEEADPTTGYEAGGFNNAWTLGQTDQDRFYALAATDSALYVLRARSITYVLGAITSDFSTTGTREGVSSTTGTVSPASVLVTDSGVYFAGSDRRLYKITTGHQIQEVATGIRVTLGTIPLSKMDRIVVSPWTEGDNSVLFGVPQSGYDDAILFPVVSTYNDECIGLWDRFQCTSLDEVLDDHGQPVVVHWGGNSPTTSRSGYAYRRLPMTAEYWSDAFASVEGSVERVLTPCYMGFHETTDQQFTEMDLSLLMAQSWSGLSYTYNTSRQNTTTATSVTILVNVPGTSVGLIARYDVGTYDASIYGGSTLREQHHTIGLSASGRWFQPTITLQSGSGGTLRFAIQSIGVRALLLDQRVGIV